MTQSNDEILMARQPIYDKDLNVVAYELLYRCAKGRGPGSMFDGNRATSQILVSNFTSIFERGDVVSVPAFVNLTEDLLTFDNIPGLPNDQVVLEVLEDVAATDEVVSSVARLAKAGYRIALDDYEHHPSFEPLLELADIVKVDLTLTKGEELTRLVDTLAPFKVKLLAEKIETFEEFEETKALGFSLFQGYFLSKPTNIKGRKLKNNATVLTQLLSALEDPKTMPEDIERIIVQDPALSFKLLRIVNSSYYGLSREISSLAQAVVLIGLNDIKKWSTLISMSDSSQKPSDISRQALLISAMCESVAKETRLAQPGTAFLTGLLSMLHLLLDTDKNELLSSVSLSEEILFAIQQYQGALGDVLYACEAYVAGNWEAVESSIAANKAIEERQLIEGYQNAIEWSQEAMSLMYNA